MAPKGRSGESKPASKGPKKKAATFVIDCAKPVEAKIMDIASLEKFLQERIKVAGGKDRAFGDSITINRDKSKVSVTSDGSFSNRFKPYQLFNHSSIANQDVPAYSYANQV